MNKETKNKSKIVILKEMWKDPRKKALIKLCFYFLLFFMIIIGSMITSSYKETTIKKEELKEFETNFTYKEMQQELLKKKYDINYEIINDNITYKLNGTLENNILMGYLELPNLIIKIKYENDIFYQLNNDVITEYDTTILFDKNLINIKNLLDILSNTQTLIKINENTKEYSYVIKINELEYNVLVSINENNIYKIILNNEKYKITMNFDNIIK